MTVLTQAHNEWANRPADERFGSLQAMMDKAVAVRERAAQAKVETSKLRVADRGGDLVLIGETGAEAKLTHWAAGQLCQKVKAPAAFVRSLSPGLAADVLNERLPSVDGRSLVLFDKRVAEIKARALTSTDYSRIYNTEVIAKLMDLESRGPWQPAPAAFDGSRGLYMGDRDMFAFMVDNNRRIFESDNGGLSRGFFCWNSEVGARSIGAATFLYEFVCGNHRVWGVKEVQEMRVAHIGTDGARAWGKIAVELKKYAEASIADDEAKIKSAHNYTLGATKEEVLDAVMKFVTRDVAGRAYDLAEQRVDWYGNPRSAWGFAGGLTELARDLPNADERSELDRAGRRIVEMAF